MIFAIYLPLSGGLLSHLALTRNTVKVFNCVIWCKREHRHMHTHTPWLELGISSLSLAANGTSGLNEELIAFSETGCSPGEGFKFLGLVKSSARERERERPVYKPGVAFLGPATDLDSHVHPQRTKWPLCHSVSKSPRLHQIQCCTILLYHCYIPEQEMRRTG